MAGNRKVRSGVIKKRDVREGSPYVLGGGGLGAAGSAAPSARIVAQNDTGVVIEVTCACGQTVQVQCNYAEAALDGEMLAAGA